MPRNRMIRRNAASEAPGGGTDPLSLQHCIGTDAADGQIEFPVGFEFRAVESDVNAAVIPGLGRRR
jgi:hypothetical protein